MTFITIDSPKAIDSKKVHSEIKKHIEQGKKTFEVNLICQFITTDEVMKTISNKFQVIKNKIAFQIRG